MCQCFHCLSSAVLLLHVFAVSTSSFLSSLLSALCLVSPSLQHSFSFSFVPCSSLDFSTIICTNTQPAVTLPAICEWRVSLLAVGRPFPGMPPFFLLCNKIKAVCHSKPGQGAPTISSYWHCTHPSGVCPSVFVLSFHQGFYFIIIIIIIYVCNSSFVWWWLFVL